MNKIPVSKSCPSLPVEIKGLTFESEKTILSCVNCGDVIYMGKSLDDVIANGLSKSMALCLFNANSHVHHPFCAVCFENRNFFQDALIEKRI